MKQRRKKDQVRDKQRERKWKGKYTELYNGEKEKIMTIVCVMCCYYYN